MRALLLKNGVGAGVVVEDNGDVEDEDLEVDGGEDDNDHDHPWDESMMIFVCEITSYLYSVFPAKKKKKL